MVLFEEKQPISMGPNCALWTTRSEFNAYSPMLQQPCNYSTGRRERDMEMGRGKGRKEREREAERERKREKLLFSKLNILSSFTFSSGNIYKTFEDIELIDSTAKCIKPNSTS